MAYVRSYGRPDLFITFTCNPKWIEIQRELLPGQRYYDRHDLTARVFKLKSTLFMNLITTGKIYGAVRCKMLSVEWQKRGLPHIHVLIWLKTKIMPNQIDDIISAELPDRMTSCSKKYDTWSMWSYQSEFALYEKHVMYEKISTGICKRNPNW